MKLHVAAPAKYRTDDAIRGGVNLMLFSYRVRMQLIAAASTEQAMGNAHFRCLYLIARRPGLPVSKLVSLLSVSKQSCSRVLAELIGRGLVEQRTGELDRRLRLLNLTASGQQIEQQLTDVLHANMKSAYAHGGEAAVAGFWLLMQDLMGTENRRHFIDLQNT